MPENINLRGIQIGQSNCIFKILKCEVELKVILIVNCLLDLFCIASLAARPHC